MSASFSSFHHHPSVLDVDHIDPISAVNAAAAVTMQQSSQALAHSHLDQITMSSTCKMMMSEEANSALSVTNKINMMSCMDFADAAGKKRKCSKYGYSPNSAQSKDMREEVAKKGKAAKRGRKVVKEEKKLLVAPTDYVHVRARRGQATDSHSLAERVRRERISERMKLLQTLVPGCEKVTGKALILDEIINYVQSLQNQVEFLSMKLAAVNPMLYDFGMDFQEPFIIKSNDLQNLSRLASAQQNSPSPSPSPSPTPTAMNNINIYHHMLENYSVNSFAFPNLTPSDIHDHQVINRQVLWEVEHDEQRQKPNNQSGFSNTLFSFH